jgi:hypothetical protein
MLSNLDRVRAEHAEILAIVLEIRHLLDPTVIKSKATALRELIDDLTRRTLAHLLLEDRCLYREMLLSQHDETRALAQQYVDCMGSTAEDLRNFTLHWPTAAAIASAPKQFCDETKHLLEALEMRISREEQHLYPKVELVAFA